MSALGQKRTFAGRSLIDAKCHNRTLSHAEIYGGDRARTLETKSYLSPAEDSLAVEELDHTGLDRRRAGRS